jgi:chaperonin GroEL
MLSANLTHFKKIGITIIPIEISNTNISEREDIMKDLISYCNAQELVFSESKGYNHDNPDFSVGGIIELENISSENNTISIAAKGHNKADSEFLKRVELVKEQLEDLKKQGSDKVRESYLQKRYSGMTAGFAILYIYSDVATERNQILSRVEDAVLACKSADKEGYIAGAGTPFRDFVSTDHISNVVNKYVSDPTAMNKVIGKIKDIMLYNERKIYSNAFIKFEDTEKIEEGHGYNLNGTDEIVDLVEANVIDPTYSLICGMKNAVAAATTLLLTNTGIIDVDKNKT